MRFLSHTTDKVTLKLSLHELHLANALIQEGRISHECDSPRGQALEDGIKSAVLMVEDSIKSGQKVTSTH
jgi:hypothetical protein